MSLTMTSTFDTNLNPKTISRDHAEKKLRFETEARVRSMWCRFKSQSMVARSRGQHIDASDNFIVHREHLEDLLGTLDDFRDEPWPKVRDRVNKVWKDLETEFQKVQEDVKAWTPSDHGAVSS